MAAESFDDLGTEPEEETPADELVMCRHCGLGIEEAVPQERHDGISMHRHITGGIRSCWPADPKSPWAAP